MISSKNPSFSTFIIYKLQKRQLLFSLIMIITVFLSSQNAAVVAKSFANDNPTRFYKECIRNEDCPTNYCCTVGMMRYTMPFCSPMGILDHICRPYNEKHNLSLAFPSNKIVNVVDSYFIICPCLEGLKCSRDTGTCLLEGEDFELNLY